MKAKIVKVTKCDPIHDMGLSVKLLWVEEQNALAIMPDGNHLVVFTNFRPDSTCRIIGEVDVPDEIIKMALSFAGTKAVFEAFLRQGK